MANRASGRSRTWADPEQSPRSVPQFPAGDGAPGAVTLAMDREGRARAMRILAQSLCKDLATRGFDNRDVLGLAGELIEQVTACVGSSQQSTAATIAGSLERRRRRA